MHSAAGPVAGLREVDPDEAAADGCTPSEESPETASDGCEPSTEPVKGPMPEEIQVPVQETLNRAITALITAVPPLLLGLGAWQMWNHGLQWRDVLIFLVMYIPVGLGVTVGFHRLLTHRSFKTSPAMRGLLGVLGTMSVEGPVISWVADHRKHHAYTDRLGDPHSPHVDHGVGVRGALRGLAHAHVGWLFDHQQRGARERFAPDLLADPVIDFVDRTFVLWSLVGLAMPFGLGVLIGGTVAAGLEGMLWGGAVRVFVLHHVTYSINSLCHFFGRQRFDTGDHSRNLRWLAPLSFGEAWHNNHHAFPTSAWHGMDRSELDVSGMLIAGMERLGLVWDVQRIGAERQAAKAISD
ncbi:MAG: Stearoyl-CoA 9-desaturase [Solirubrobacterales bacterium]|nr:Stearoyl-CoA 9-desaturase [Solirubrobacterales bacterium]